MSRFKIHPQRTRSVAESFASYTRTLSGSSSTVSSIGSHLAISGSARTSVAESLRRISEEIEREQTRMTASANTLYGIANRYEAADGRLLSPADVAWNADPSAASGARGNTSSGTSNQNSPGASSKPGWTGLEAPDILELLYKVGITAGGPVGLIIDGIRRGFEGKWGNVVSDIFKFAGGIAKNTSGTGINWGGLFGLVTSDKTPWAYATGKYFDFSTVGKGISSACQWAAQIAVSAYENYQEFHNFSARFWEETAAETLLKVGEGILITAGVAAAAAAIGISAPAVAIGAVAAGVTVLVDWGLNEFTKWVTDGAKTKWYDAVGDVICDVGEDVVQWVGDHGKELAMNVVDGGKKAVDAVVDGGRKAVDAIKDGAGTLVNWGKMAFGF